MTAGDTSGPGALGLAVLSERARIRFNGQAGITRCEREWSWSPPPMPDWDVWVVLGGRGAVTWAGNDVEVLPGHAYVFGPGDRLRARHDPDDRLVVFFCHFDVLDANGVRMSRDGIRWPPFPVVVQDLSGLEAAARVVALGAQRADVLSRRRAELALWEILLRLAAADEARREPAMDARIERVLRAIQHEPGDAWSVARMARMAGLSRTQFARLFTRQAGMPPNRYVSRVRVERARTLITESDLPLAVIAEALGYRDVYFFSRQFKQWTSVPPGSLRRRRG